MTANEPARFKGLLILGLLVFAPIFVTYMMNISADPSAKPYDSNPAPSGNQAANATLPAPQTTSKPVSSNNALPTDTIPALQMDYNNIWIGDSQAEATKAVGRLPDRKYRGTDGATVLYFKDEPLNELRIMVKNGSVYEVSYMPAEKTIENTQIKSLTYTLQSDTTPLEKAIQSALYAKAFHQVVKNINDNNNDALVTDDPSSVILVSVISGEKSTSDMETATMEQIGEATYGAFRELRIDYNQPVAAPGYRVIVDGPSPSDPVLIIDANGTRIGP